MTDQNLPAPAQERPVRAPITTGGTVAALIPQDIEQAYRIASAFAGSGMVPSAFANKPEACFVAIMAGAEVGLPPFQAMQSFAIINGRPSMWGDALVAVIRNQGFTMKEWFVGEGDDMVAHCAITRPDNGEVTLGEFSVADARKAGLWSKAGPWQTSPKRMLKMRARAFAIRDGAADVLRGFQVREEVDDYQAIETAPAKQAPTSLRAKLPDQTGRQGFDPNHVEAETVGEVIEGEATPTAAKAGQRDEAAIQAGQKAEPGEAGQAMADIAKTASTEAEAKGDLAAALASLDTKPAAAEAQPEAAADPEPSGEADVETVEVQPEPVTDPEPQLDGADDLIRQNAFDDGFAGDAVDAVLIMCETEAEADLARRAHAEGVAARIAKEAADHEASAKAEEAARAEETRAASPAEIAEAKAATTPDFTDVAGPAPAGEKYLLVTEEPGADGKVTIYRDGEIFSRVAATAAAGKYSRFDGHPQPTDPALASQSGGTGDAPAAASAPETKTAPEPETMKPNGLYLELAAMESWLQIKPRLTQLYGSEAFKALSAADQAATRAHVWNAVLEMKEARRDPVDHATDPAAFGLWVDWMATQDQLAATDRVEAIEGTLATLQFGRTWKERLTDPQRTALELRASGVISKIKGT